jgi:hypothetical protein
MLDSIEEIPIEKEIKIFCLMECTETDRPLIITAQNIETISSVKVVIK